MIVIYTVVVINPEFRAYISDKFVLIIKSGDIYEFDAER